jgi:Ser/Thr protein kinase RdoA (MazF antagonist)
VTAGDALRIAAAFGVDVRGAAAEPLTGGYSNESWHVDGPAAAAVVRRYGRLHVSRAALTFEHAVAAHLAARGADVRAPLCDPAGATLHTDAGGFVAALPWVEGVTGLRDRATGEAAARALARFHLAGRDMHVSGGTRATRFLGVMPWLIARFQRFAAADSPTARALPWDDLIVAVSASTARLATRARLLPAAIVHGDPNPGNVVVRDGRVRALIDFDFVHESERVYDVGALLDEFGRDGDDAPLALERLGPLVAAYESEARLTGEERAALPDAMLRRAATLVWYVVTRHGERLPGDVGGAPRYAARVREIARSVEAIRHAA